ncbi:MAG: glycosyltransferase [Promethearchaeota archaeon]
MTLNVLHLSHSGLPDPRVERLAMMSQSYAKSIFLGPPSSSHRLHQEAFSEVRCIDAFTTASKLGLPFFYKRLLDEVKEHVKVVEPDLIYAHNIITGKVARDLGLPFVYDDHEYWSREMKLKRIGVSSIPKRMKNRIRRYWVPQRYLIWEKEVLPAASATVTVSEAIAKEHRRNGANCSVIPNFPLKQESEHIPTPELHQGNLKAISLSSDSIAWVEHRYPGNHMEMWEKEGGINVDWVGRPPPKEWKWIQHRNRIPPADLYEVLTRNYQLGLIPWTRCWFHRYVLSNKLVSYSHSGLIILLTDDFETMLGLLPNWGRFIFGGDEDLKQVMKSLQKMSPEEIVSIRKRLQRWAKEEVVLDKYTDALRAAIFSTQDGE